MLTVGADGTRGAWVAVALSDGRFAGAERVDSAVEVLARWPEAVQLGFDIPIGLVDERRDADLAARRALGPRGSTVFPAPSASAIGCDTYEQANEAQRASVGVGLSRQTYALRERILDAAVVASDARVVEVHPELVFARLAGTPLPPKKTWAGQRLRQRLLEASGVLLPDDLGEVGLVPVDDVLDAAVVALAARHAKLGVARRFPDPPTQHDPEGRPIVIFG